MSASRGPETTSAALAERLGGSHHGPDRAFTRLAAPGAPARDAAVVWADADPRRVAELAEAGVACLVVGDERGDAALRAATARAGVALVIVANPRLALARMSAAFDGRPLPAPEGVHPSAVVDEGARVGARARIGPGAVVRSAAVVGDDVVIGAHSVVGQGSSVGDGSVLFDRVVLYDGVSVGRRARLHAGVVIGADGLGYAFGPHGAEKIHHLGGVVVGDDVEIGANTAIDRGSLENTVIGDRVKIDNLCQIAHNVTIGDDVVIAGLTGLAGSCRIGSRVIVGGACAVADHVSVGDDARLAGGTGVTKDVPPGETWGGLPAQPFRRWVRERYLVGRLERIWAAVRALGPDA